MNDIYTQHYMVSGADMDVDYRLTRTAAAKYFQETFARMCARHGQAAFDVSERGLLWVIAELHVEFPGAMPYWGEAFSVRVWMSEKGRIRSCCDFEILCGERLVARGESCWYLLNMASRRPSRSQDAVADFPQCGQKALEGGGGLPFVFEGEPVASHVHRVSVLDLDFNHHVNNLSYVGISLETVPAEYLDELNVDAYRVKFVQEARLGDELHCDVYRDAYRLTARISKVADGSDVCHLACRCSDRSDFGRNPREAGIAF